MSFLAFTPLILCLILLVQGVSKWLWGAQMMAGVKQNTWFTRQVPADWKLVNVPSIHKKGQKDDLGNYRPVKPNLGSGQGYGRDYPEYHCTVHAVLFIKSKSKRRFYMA